MTSSSRPLHGTGSLVPCHAWPYHEKNICAASASVKNHAGLNSCKTPPGLKPSGSDAAYGPVNCAKILLTSSARKKNTTGTTLTTERKSARRNGTGCVYMRPGSRLRASLLLAAYDERSVDLGYQQAGSPLKRKRRAGYVHAVARGRQPAGWTSTMTTAPEQSETCCAMDATRHSVFLGKTKTAYSVCMPTR